MPNRLEVRGDHYGHIIERGEDGVSWQGCIPCAKSRRFISSTDGLALLGFK